MRIESSTLSFASLHLATRTRTRSESLKAWAGSAAPSRQAPAQGIPSAPQPHPVQSRREASRASDAHVTARLQALRLLIEKLTGRRIRLLSAGETPTPPDDLVRPTEAAAAEAQPRAQGWGATLTVSEIERETEDTLVTLTGEVTTADGRTLAVALDLTMSREYEERTDLRIALGDARLQDPLVINLSGEPIALGSDTVSFDLDADGRAEERLPTLKAGSGFLALDRDGDGTIGSGRELFGPSSTDGFAELASLDRDGNGWIDEGDEAFAELRIWTPGAGGGGQFGLTEAGIGALSVTGVASPFSLTDAANTLLARVRATGMYLREDGTFGSVQQLDLAV